MCGEAWHAPGGRIVVCGEIVVFIVLPIGADRSAYGMPWVTLGIMVACGALLAADFAGFDTVAHLGHRPVNGVTYRLVASMFAHAGVFHLAGNMWFLWFLGVNLETRLGSFAYLAFYLTCGVAATLLYSGLHRGSDVPLVGASGAISGVMGAFLASMFTARIRLWYGYFILLVVRWFAGTGTFRLPAYLVLPFWFAQDVAGMTSEDSTGVAYSAHVGGFVLGVVLVLLLRVTRLEQKLLDHTGADAWDDPTKWTEVSARGVFNATSPRASNSEPPVTAAAPSRCKSCGLVNMPGQTACRRCGDGLVSA